MIFWLFVNILRLSAVGSVCISLNKSEKFIEPAMINVRCLKDVVLFLFYFWTVWHIQKEFGPGVYSLWKHKDKRLSRLENIKVNMM